MCIALLALGVFVGIIFGSIPGLTATLGVTLFIPFTYTMQPVQGLVMLIAVYVGGMSGGLITATLINIPGTPSSIYTCFDGYPMTKKGKPAQALAIGVFCSLIGGTFSAFALMAIAPQLAKVSLSFGSWEYFAVALMGLSVVVAMCSDSLIKGLIGAVFGLLIGTVGIDSISGVSRLTFGFWQLQGGISSTALMMGLFALIITGFVGMLFGMSFLTTVLYSAVGLVVFMLLTAYDTQKLSQMFSYYAYDGELAEKASIYGALTLYLDFINIFLYVVRLLGMNSRRRN